MQRRVSWCNSVRREGRWRRTRSARLQQRESWSPREGTGPPSLATTSSLVSRRCNLRSGPVQRSAHGRRLTGICEFVEVVGENSGIRSSDVPQCFAWAPRPLSPTEWAHTRLLALPCLSTPSSLGEDLSLMKENYPGDTVRAVILEPLGWGDHRCLTTGSANGTPDDLAFRACPLPWCKHSHRGPRQATSKKSRNATHLFPTPVLGHTAWAPAGHAGSDLPAPPPQTHARRRRLSHRMWR